ncbi:MAG: lysine biosynthesis protein LysW [Gemmatimonadota bacterium]|nr:MAG: lysine biosynthesis protein LysW [Gemmatimonadota bacterium]
MSAEAECPECAAVIELDDDVVEGEIVTCTECGMELEVVPGNPWSLTPAPEEEEDWGE